MSKFNHLDDVIPFTKEQFFEDYAMFMSDNESPIVKIPSLGYKELDLHRLYCSVIKRGGMDEVCR